MKKSNLQLMLSHLKKQCETNKNFLDISEFITADDLVIRYKVLRDVLLEDDIKLILRK